MLITKYRHCCSVLASVIIAFLPAASSAAASSDPRAAIYKIPHQIGRDSFDSDEVIFANSAVGILTKGLHSEELAAKYDLKPESSKLLGTSSKGFSRELPEHLQPARGLAGPGKVSIVAREGSGLEGKTLLACEFVPD